MTVLIQMVFHDNVKLYIHDTLDDATSSGTVKQSHTNNE